MNKGQKMFALFCAMILICGGVWMGLPMSVFSEQHPTATTVFKVIGTILGAGGIYGIYLLNKRQNK